MKKAFALIMVLITLASCKSVGKGLRNGIGEAIGEFTGQTIVKAVLDTVQRKQLSSDGNWVYILTSQSSYEYYIDLDSIIQEGQLYTYNKLIKFQYPNRNGVKAMIISSGIDCNSATLYEFDRLEINSQDIVIRRVNLKEPGVSLVKSETAGYSYWEYFCSK
ncbi:hypothetical protein [Nostoc sp. CALU 1950]|uniref:hypothetical protein n=1 Tax=Nostoc sp. CALU 1950 TaxID=3104321 RepID=UPI003EB7D30E